MRKTITKLRLLSFMALLALCSSQAVAQTVLINPTLEGGFELGPTFADNGWTVVNTATANGPQWFMTNAALTNGAYNFAPTGSNAAYISSDLGTSWSYQTPAAANAASHFYRDVTFPAGETAMNLSFRFNASGESTWDDIHVYLCPTTLTPVVNQPTGTSTAPTWSGTGTPIFLGRYNLLAAGAGATVNLPLNPTVVGNCSAAATWRIVFTWKNDTGGGTNPPAAIDDIALISSASPITSAGGNFTIDNTLPTAGTNFQSFTAAITALNAAGACGPFLSPVIFDVTEGQSFAELPPVITATGSPGIEIIFQKAGGGANPVIIPTGTASTTDGAIVIAGGDYFIFDGIDINASAVTNMEFGYRLNNISGTNGAQFNTFRNFTITMNRANTASRGISMAVPTAATAASGANSNNTFQDFTIRNVYAGIQMAGTAGFPDLNTVIGTTSCAAFNIIGDPAVLNDIGSGTSVPFGISITNASNFNIFNNIIRNVTNNSGQADGIVIGAFQGTSSVYNNIIQGIRNSGTGSTGFVSGMRASHATTGTHSLRIYNNSISNITSGYTGTATATRVIKGIFINGTGGATTQNYQIHNNSVSINGSGSLNNSSVCFEIATTSGPVYNLSNNVFANFTAAQTGVARHYGLFSTSATSFGPAGTTSLNNDIFIANDLGVTGFTGIGNATTYATLANWSATMTPAGLETGSIAVNPGFVNNASDLHATAIELNASGAPLQAYVTTDLDCATRSDNDMGAFNLTACSGTPTAGTINGNSAICSGLSTNLTLTGASVDAGISYQWASSTTPGGPYTNLGTSGTQNTGAMSVTTYYVVTTTCSVSGLSSVTPEFNILVNSLPTVSVTPNTGLICLPGGASIPLTASSATATTYSWSPSAGLSATTGTDVIANPTSTTNYTVSGTDANGCIGTAVAAITIANNPVISSVTATPSDLCVGDDSQLEIVLGPTTVNTYSFSSGTGTTLDPMTGSTQVLNSGNDDTPSALLPIGFTFNYNGTNYTNYSVSPDGWVVLGSAGGAQFTNAVTSATNTPKLYPYWDDLATGTTGNVQALVTGTAPNRILVLQWFVTVPRNTGGPANSTFQAWLYESNGAIEFRYGAMGAGAMSASVGLTGGTTNYNSVTIASGTNSTSTPNDLNAGQPANGTIYTFAPTPVSVSWSPSTYLSSTTVTNPVANNVLGSVTYTVTATAPTTCSSTGTVSITAGVPLTAVATATPGNTVCAGTNVTLNALPSGGGAPYTYSWSGPGTFASIDQNPVLNSVSNLQSGTYTVLISDNCGSTTTASVTLTVNDLPVVAVSPTSATYCVPGPAVTLNASGANTYSWSPSAGLSATTGTSVDATPSALTTYTVTGTDGNGCTSTATTVIGKSSSVNINNLTATPSSVCSGDNSTLVADASLAAPSAYCQPVYSNGTGFGDYISSVSLNTLNNTSVGSAAPYYTLYPQTGSTTTTLTAGSTYTLTLSAGTYTSNDLAAWIDYNQNGILDDAGEKLGETNNLGASPATTSFTFTVPAIALNGVTRLRVREMDYGGTNAMTPCEAQSTYGEVEDYDITISGGSDPITYAWTPSTFLSSTNTASTTATAITSTTTYTLTASEPGGCVATGPVTVTVNVPTSSTIAPIACDSYTSPDGSVYTTSGTYVNVIPNAAGCDSTITINLTVNNSTSSTISPIACDSYTSPSGTVYTTSGTYTSVIPNAAGCDSTITINLTVNNSTSSTINPVVCDSYLAPDGSTYNTTGTYTAIIPNAAGCDSIITINLTAYGSSSSTINPVVCDSYTSPDGSVYTVSGTYVNVIPNFIGCDSIITINLSVNYTPALNAGADVTVCQNGQVTLTASGAVAYTWDNGITNGIPFVATGTTTYTVTGTSVGGCTATDQVTVTVVPLPSVEAGANITQCGDQSVTLSGSGATVYSWNNGVVDGVAFNAPFGTTSYIVTGVDAFGCSNSDIVTVTIGQNPNATATFADELTLVAGAFNGFYQWIDCANNTAIAGATSAIFNVTENGSYAVVMTTMDGCSDTSDCLIIDYVGIKDVEANFISLYPNPTRDQVTITMKSEKAFVEVVDAQGKLVISRQIENGGNIDLTSFENGVYIFKITTDSETSVHRISKN
jgi:hypothetical protein